MAPKAKQAARRAAAKARVRAEADGGPAPKGNGNGNGRSGADFDPDGDAPDACMEKWSDLPRSRASLLVTLYAAKGWPWFACDCIIPEPF